MRVASAAAAALALTAVPAVGTVVAARITVDAAVRVRSGPPDVEGTVLLGAAAAAVAALAWLTVACAAGAAQAGTRLARRSGPTGTALRVLPQAPARTAGVSAIVCAAVLAVAGPATAAQSPPGWDVSVTSTADGVTAAGVTASPVTAPGGAATPSGWVPRISPVPPSATALVTSEASATAGSDPDRATTDRADHPERTTRVVHRGDSLWSLAADHLGPDATAGEIAAEWPRWWQANREVVGDDPDVLLPGQVLRIP